MLPPAQSVIDDIIVQLDDNLERALVSWANYLRQTGCPHITLARRDDSIKAFYVLLGALKTWNRSGLSSPQLGDDDSVATRYFLAAARDQRARGASAEMGLTGLKAMRQAIEDLILGMILLDSAKLQALGLLRRYYDQLETKIIVDWEQADKEQVVEALEKTNQRLVREKHTYESIFESTSNLVLITDGKGTVQKTNPEARLFFSGQELTGQYCGTLLGLPGAGLDELLRQVVPHRLHEITLESGSYCRVFNLQIKPLAKVSISSPGIMLILGDITSIVDHRQLLAERIAERTQALANSEKMLNAIFQSVGKGILLFDSDREIVKANQQASEIYGLPLEVLVGSYFCSLIDPLSCLALNEICQNLVEGQSESTEITSIYVDGTVLPCHITITRMDLDGQLFWPVIIRDISEQRALEDGLRSEKLQSEEMNVTLRNVLKSIESDRREAEQNLSHRVKASLLPGLEKVRKETSAEVRSSYIGLLRDQLISLTSGFEMELDGDLLKLSKTELKVCRFIKSGLSGKEICQALNLSFETIQTHRKNIRKKLGLSGKTINLHTYLVNRNCALGGLDGD